MAQIRARINQQIRAKDVRVIDKDGKQVGLMSLEEALRQAQEQELDLVEVAAKAEPPVVRIIDFKKYRYEKKRKEHKAAKGSKSGDLKEFRFGPHIGPNDLNIRIERAKEFLAEGNKIKLTVKFRGQQKAHPQVGIDKVNYIVGALKDVSEVEQAPKMEGSFYHIVLKAK